MRNRALNEELVDFHITMRLVKIAFSKITIYTLNTASIAADS